MVDFEKRKEDLVRKIEITKKYKQKLINYVQELKNKRAKEEIQEDEFYEKLKNFLKGKSVSEWIKYYDDCIEVYEKHLNYYRKISQRKYKPLPQAKSLKKKKTLPVKNIMLLFLGFAIFGLLFFVTINNGSLTGFASWYDSGWDYRKNHTIVGTSAGAQTNYVMHFVVHSGSGTDSGENVYCEGNCQNDFGDIRFTNASGSDLDYFLEEYNSGENASFWVEIDSIPASPNNVTISIYYGNSNVETTSNGDTTFVEFEGFEDTNFIFDTGSITLGNNDVDSVTGSYSGNASETEGNYRAEYASGTDYDVDDFFFEFQGQWISSLGNNNDFLGGLQIATQSSETDGYQSIIDARDPASPQIRKDTDYGSREDGNYQVSTGDWNFVQFYRESNDLVSYLYDDSISLTQLGSSTMSSETSYQSGEIGLFCYACNNIRWDNYRVRKRANPEPTHGDWSSEETENIPDNPPSVSLDKPEDNYYENITQFVDLTFNASVSDSEQLVNCSLWHNATGTWHLNQTEDVIGTSNTTEFNLTNLNNVSFIWNIECYDNVSQSSFADSNRSVVLNYSSESLNPMNITFENPTPNMGEDLNSRDFAYINISVTDSDGIDSVFLEWNTTWGRFNYSMKNGSENIFYKNMTRLINRSFQYRVYANDSLGNMNVSNWRNFSVSYYRNFEYNETYWEDYYINKIAGFWQTYSIDETYGGFYNWLNKTGGIDSPIWVGDSERKVSEAQGRILYGLVLGYNLTGNQTYLDNCPHAYKFMKNSLWDSEEGGWYQGHVNASGGSLSDNDKQYFDNSWAPIGLWGCYWSTGNETYLDLAEETYVAYENAYNETEKSYAINLYDNLSIKDSDINYGSMMDTTLGLSWPLYLLTENETYLNRTLDVVDSSIKNMIDPENTGHYVIPGNNFWANWTYQDSSDDVVSTGHNTKYAWILLYLYDLTGNETYYDTGKAVFDNVTQYGFDYENGTWYNSYYYDNHSVVSGNRDWWIQEDGIVTSYLLYKYTGEDKYYDLYKKASSFYLDYFLDKEYGEVYSDVYPSGNVADSFKAKEWKGAYHSAEIALLLQKEFEGDLKYPYHVTDPEIESMSVDFNVSSGLNCFATINTQFEGEDVWVNYTWYNDSVKYSSGNSSSFSEGVNTLVSNIGTGNVSSGENWTCSVKAYDGTRYSDNYTNDSIIISYEAPNITSIKDINEAGVEEGEIERGDNVTINATVTDVDDDVDSVWVKVWQGAVGVSQVIFRGVLDFITGDLWSIDIETNDSFDVGENNYTVYANDTTGLEVNDSGSINISDSSLPIYSSFNGETTDFTQVGNLESVSNVVLEKPEKGKIKWNNNINASGQDFDSYVDISDEYIFVNSSALDSSINSSANLTLYNLSLTYPVIFKDGSLCSDCNKIDYSGGNFSFQVQGFSNYTAREGTNLSIWDDTDSQTKNTGEQINFYANYTNVTSGDSINGTDVYCEFRENSSGSFVLQGNMTFNSSEKIYEYNKSFTSSGDFVFNVSCYNNQGYANLSVVDDFVVGSGTNPTISNLTLNSTTGNNITTDNLTCYAQGNDAESSTLDYFAQWKKNGEEFYFNKTYNSSEGNWYYGADLDSNRNFYVGGFEFNSDEDFKIIKFDKDLNKLNDASFDFGGDDRARGLAVDDENDYIYLSGYSDVSDKDVKIIMLNSSLDEQWNLTWGGSEDDLGYVSNVGPNGYLYAVARTNSYNTTPGQDLAMLKIDSSGNIVWNRSYGDPAGGSISAYGGGVDNEGNAIAMGWWNDGTSLQSKVVKWYANGTKAWDTDYGNDTKTDAPTFMTADSQNNYIMTAGGGDSWYVWKTYPNGTLIWENYLTNPTGYTCEAEGVVTGENNKIYVTGYCSSNGNGYALTVAYDSNGNQIWNKTNNVTPGVDEGKAIVLDEGENIYVGGPTNGGNGPFAFKFYGSELLNGNNGSMNLVGTMNSTYTSVGDNWSCEVSAYDGTISSDFNVSNNLTILNANPNITSIKDINESGVEDGIVQIGENVTINATVTDVDEDVESVWVKVWQGAVGVSQVIFRGLMDFISGDLWSIDVKTNESFNAGENNYTVYANDSSGNEINESGNFTILTEGIPSIENLTLNSTFGTNYTNENLTCHYDLNGSANHSRVRWNLNGSSIFAMDMPFEAESNNTYTKDYSNPNSNITLYNMVWNSTGGYDSFGAYEFDGDGDYILSNKTCNGATEFTITVWVKSDVTNTDNGVLIGVEPDGTDSVCGIRYDAGGWAGGGTNLIKAGINVDNGTDVNNIQIESSNNSQTTDWQFLVLRWESGDELELFINGELDTPTYSGGSATGSVTGMTGIRLGLGAKDTPGSSSWDGKIDEYRVYNRKLSAEQIKTIYSNETDKIVSQETNVGDTWQCEVTPFSSTQEGTTQESNNLTILNAVPNITSIKDINESGVEDGTVQLNDNVTINATVTDVDSSDDIESVWVKIWQGAVGVSQVIFRGLMDFISGDLWSIDIETNGSFSQGDVNYTVYANDSSGNEINDSGVFKYNKKINITSCQELNVSGAIYVLQNNLSSTGTCLNVTASNITIDGEGYEINHSTSDTGYGIYSDSQDGLIIRDLLIWNFYNSSGGNSNSRAIFLENSQGHNISSIKIEHQGPTSSYNNEDYRGIFFNNVDLSNIEKVNISMYGGRGAESFYLLNSNNNSFENLNTFGNRFDYHALYLENSNYNNFDLSNFSSISPDSNQIAKPNIELQSSDYNVFSNNSVSMDDVLQVSGTLIDGTEYDGISSFFMQNSSFNEFYSNNFSAEIANEFLMMGTTSNHFNHTFNENNLVQGAPIKYNPVSSNSEILDYNSTNAGLLILANLENITVKNSDLFNGGIQFYNSNNITVKNSSFESQEGSSSIFFESSGNVSILDNSFLKNLNDVSNSLVVLHESHNSIFSNNIFNSTHKIGSEFISIYDSHEGVLNNSIFYGFTDLLRLGEADNWEINSLLTYGVDLPDYNSASLIFSNLENLTIKDVYTENTGSVATECIVFENNVNNVYIENATMSISSSSSQAKCLDFNDNLNNVSFVDSVFTASDAEDVRVESSAQGSVTFINSSYNESDINWLGSSFDIFFGYHADIYVNSTSGDYLENANISSYLSNGTLKKTSLTDSLGYTRHDLLEYRENSTSKYYSDYSNYTINASKGGYTSNNSNVNMIDNKVINFYLTLLLNITNISDINESGVEDGGIKYKDNVTINASVSGDVDSVWVKVWQGAVGVSQVIFRGVLDFITGDLWSIDIETNASFNPENNYTVYANDTSGNQVNDSGNFSFIPPKVSNVILNSSLGNNDTEEDLFCNYDLSSDASKNATREGIFWTKDGKSVKALNIPFEGNSTNALKDYSGNGNDASNYGDAIWNYTGGHNPNDGAFEFTGENTSYLIINHSESLNLTSELSISAWIKPKELESWDRIVAKSHTSDSFPYTIYGILLDDSGHIRMEVSTSGGSQNTVNGNTTLPLNKWTFVTGTYDGDEIRVYVNGTLDGINDISGDVDTNTMPVTIGRSGFDNNAFNGTIDDVKIWNLSLCEFKVDSLYNNGSNIIPSCQTRVGDVWQCGVTPFTPIQAGTTVYSNNLTIKGDESPVSSLDSPINREAFGNYETIIFNATATDDKQLKNCTFWHNATGIWHLNQTQNLTGVSNVSEFNLTDLVNVTFDWTIRCYDNASQINLNGNRTVIVSKEPLVNVSLNSSSGNHSTSDNLTCSYNVSSDAVSSVISWEKDNKPFSILNTPFEGGGSIDSLRDYSGNGEIGTNYGAVWNSSGGFNGTGAYEFDGVNDRITYPFECPHEIESRTLTAWVKKGEDTGAEIVSIAPVTGFQQSAISITGGGGNLQCSAVYNNGNAYLGWDAIAEDEWTFVACVFDYNASSKNMTHTLYVDGSTSSGVAENVSSYSTSASRVFVGSRDSANGFLNGTVDNVRIYDRSLSIEQLDALYNNESNLIVSQETSVGNDWKCEATPFSNIQAGDTQESNSIPILPSTNYAPNISVSSIPNISPTESSTTTVEFFVNVSDNNGFEDINDSSINASFSRTGEATRHNSSCSFVNEIDSLTANYSCKVDMWYFDEAGDWNVSVYAKDNFGAVSVNDSTSFVYNKLTAFIMFPSSLNWTEISTSETNQLADNNPILMNNTGNDIINSGNTKIKAFDLLGLSDSSKIIYAENFSVNINNACEGDSLINNTFVNITSSILSRGNNSLNLKNETSGQEELYFCLESVNSGLTTQNYSSSIYGAWEISILLAVLVPAGKRKKKKKKYTSKELDKLAKELKAEGVVGELINKLIDLPKEQKQDEIIKEAVPVSIFQGELGPSESLAKYLKENKKMKFSEISKIINRDPRTISLNYKNAIKKLPKKIKERKDSFKVPLEIFSNRKLSVLESLVYYLRQEGYKNSKIGEMLERDSRIIWTLYSRAKEKLSKK